MALAIGIWGKDIRTCDFNEVTDESAYLVDMSECNISAIDPLMQWLENTKELQLSFNDIMHLRKNNFNNLKNLKFLFLCDNQIQKIDVNTFEELHELLGLDLSANNIESIDGLFEKNVKLLILNLERNLIKRVHRDAFNNLHSLTLINLNHNLLEELDEGIFRNNRNMTNLALKYNNLRRIGADFFRNLKNLKTISMIFNNLTELAESTFVHNKELEVVSIIGNQLRVLNGSLLKSLPKLSHFYSNLNQLNELADPELFKHNPDLIVIKLKHNNISLLHDDTFKASIALQQIDIASNRLSNISVNLFKWNSELRIIHLSNNNIRNIDEKAFESQKKLTLIALDHNIITHIPSGLLSNKTELEILKLSKNKIESIAVGSFTNNSMMEILFLDHNEICELPDGIFQDNIQLKELNLANNRLSAFGNSTFSNLKFLTHLQLQHNQMKSFEYKWFEENINLVVWNCSNNHLGKLNELPRKEKPNLREFDLSRNPILKIRSLHFTDSDITKYYIWDSMVVGNAIRSLETLRRIHFSMPTFHVRRYDLILTIIHCGVKEVTCDDQPITAVLDLSHNQLKTIECVTNMSKLNILNLSNNHFQSLSASWFVQQTYLRTLNITDNGMSVHLKHFIASTELKELYISNNSIAWSWSLYQINYLFPRLQNISITDINVFCPLLDTILISYMNWNITVADYIPELNSTDLSVRGIPCVDYRFLKYVSIEMSLSVSICIILLLIIIIHKNSKQ